MLPDRRRFLARLGQAAAGLVALTGCDRLSDSVWFNDLLDKAEPVTRVAQRLVARGALAREYSVADITRVFPANGTSDPDDDQYQAWVAAGFTSWRLSVGGLV